MYRTVQNVSEHDGPAPVHGPDVQEAPQGRSVGGPEKDTGVVGTQSQEGPQDDRERQGEAALAAGPGPDGRDDFSQAKGAKGTGVCLFFKQTKI